jgi:hypothetical protein
MLTNENVPRHRRGQGTSWISFAASILVSASLEPGCIASGIRNWAKLDWSHRALLDVVAQENRSNGYEESTKITQLYSGLRVPVFGVRKLLCGYMYANGFTSSG